MSKQLPLDWTKHLANQPEDKDNLEKTIRNSTTTLTRLLDVLEEKKSTINTIETSIKSYDDPSWAYKQAYLNGKRASLEEVINLLSFLKG